MTLFPEEMESERLRYERVHPADLDPLALYEHVKEDAPHIDEITRYVTWEPHEHPGQTADWIERCGTRFEDGEGGTYAIRPAAGDRAGEFAGVASLHPDWEHRRATLGTWLRKPFWGRGYSGERAGRMLELAFDRLDLELVSVSHDPENDNSRRAIRKYVDRFGGRREGQIRNAITTSDEVRDTVRYSISREEWQATIG